MNMADVELMIKIPEELKEALDIAKKENAFDYMKVYNDTIYDALKNGTPLPEMFDRENSEIKNEINLLSKRVETLEKQMKEDKEEQLKKLEAELDYAKFRCALPTIMDMMSHKNGN